jgi:hypothetical protein
VVTDAEKYFEPAKDGTRLYHAVKKKLSEQRKFVLWRDAVKHDGNPKAGRTAISQTGVTATLEQLGVADGTLAIEA